MSSELKVGLKQEDEKFVFDLRCGVERIRKSITSTPYVAEQIKNAVLLVNKYPELLQIENEMVGNDFEKKVYENLNVDPSDINQVEKEKIDFVVNSATEILTALNKKMARETKKITTKYIDEFSKVNTQNLIKVLLLGQFGYGKSTITKSLSDFVNYEEEVDFPVVDTSRTTTYTSHYIFKKAEKDVQFRFYIDFKTSFEIFNLVMEATYRATDRIFISLISEDEDRTKEKIRDLAMEEFVNDPNKIFKIEYVLGKYYKKDNSKRYKESKKDQVDFWDKEFEKLFKICSEYYNEKTSNEKRNEEGNSVFKKRLYDDFIKDSEAIEQLENFSQNICDHLLEKLDIICKKQEENGLGKIVYDEDQKTLIGFQDENYQVEKISDYITPFSSTKIENFTKIVTPLVDTIVIEVPYNKYISDEYTEKPICITDTIGFEHIKSEDTKSLEGSTKYKYRDFDVIGVVDKATASMSPTTENILSELYNNANKSKVMILYTFYDEFDKKDFEDEEDKKDFLIDLQKTTIKKIASNKNDEFIEEVSNIDRTIFLSGLCPDDEEGQSKLIVTLNHLMEKVGKLFKGLYSFKSFEVVDKKRELIEFNYKKIALVFNESREEYFNKQKEIYLINYPHYKTTEALTRRLSYGETYFIGTSRTLKPVDDFCSIFMENMEKFIKNPVSTNFETKNDVSDRYKEKVLDWFKEEVSSAIKDVAKRYFVTERMDNWYNLYLFSGTGSDRRRRTGIVEQIDEIVPNVSAYTMVADKWLDEIERIFKASLQKIQTEIQNK